MKVIPRFLIILFLHVMFFVSYAFSNPPLKKVTLQLSWFDQFQFAGYYMAKEKGFYKDVGFDVEIIPFRFGLDISKDVEEGKTDFAIGRETLILERASGKSIVALYALFQVSPLILIAKESSNIKSIRDFMGKRIMATIDDASEVSLKAMFNASHLSNKAYTFIEHSHNIQDLVDEKVDIISAYISKAPFDLKQQNVPYKVFSPSEHGFDMYSDFLFTSEKLIKENHDMVVAFKEASLKGWQYAYSHIDESVDVIFEKYNPQKLSKEALSYEGEELKKLSFYQTETLGKIEKNKLQRIYDLYNVMGFISKQMKIESFVLNNFGELTKEEREYLDFKGEIKVCSDPHWMPLEQIENGKLMGISVDYLELVQKMIGTSFTLVPTADWKESLKFAKERKCDILSLAMPTPERKKYMDFSKPYLVAPLVLATKTDKFFVTDIKEILKEKIGVVKGYSFGELLKLEYPTIRLVEVQSVEEGLEKVAKGEIYGFLDSLITIGYVIQKEYLNVLKIGGKIPQSFQLGFAVRNDEPVLLAILEKALENIDENTRQAITNKWVNIKYENGFDYSLLWKLIVVFGLLFLFFGYRYSVVHRYNLQIKKNLEVIDQYVLFLHTDKKGIITDVSQALCELCGYKKHELIGKSEKMLRHSDMSFCQSKECLSKITKNQAWEGELKNIKKDGTTYWVYAQISPTFAQNGEVIGYSSFQTDITDKKRIEEISHTDQLTQIFNRLYLDRSLKIELSRVRRYKDNFFSIILMDIDFFKDINDSYGHTVGDSILKDIVRLIKDNIRESDVFGRWGGEEFLIVCPNTTKKDALLLAEKIRQKIQDYKFGLDITCTMSFGVTEYETSDDEDSIFLRVDKALYIAKNTGRNRVSFL